MSTTTAPLPGPVLDVRGLDVRESLEAIAARRREADRAEAELLSLAVHLVDLHPVTEDTPTAGWVLDDRPIYGPPTSAQVAGTGAPEVAELAVEELGAALSVSYRSALTLVSEALELCFRLPRLWQLVQSGRLQAWKARAVARETATLSSAAVDFLDRHAAVLGATNRVPANIRAAVHEARLRCDPEIADGVEEAALSSRDVSFDYRHGDSTATTRMTATLDTLDALDLDATIGDLATSMGRLGDTTPVGVRRAHALGMLAHPQRVLDVFGGDEASTSRDANASGATLYLHIEAADLRTAEDGGSGTGGSVEKLGTATLALLGEWLQRADRVYVRPVLDMNRGDVVDPHDPPGWMRETVILRDGHCVFPGCTVGARVCDLDHIAPYVSPDDGGPPGQTSVDNLACLCRRHHRLKTFTAWSYERLAVGEYVWTSPYALTYRARPTRLC